MLLLCQPSIRSQVHRFTKIKSRTSSSVLVLNVGLLLTLQKFRSALTQHASRSSPRGFISEDPHSAMRICIVSYNSSKLFIFKIMLENARNLAENLRRPFVFVSFGDRLKNFFEDLFFSFWSTFCACVLGPWPWPRAFLFLASRGSALGRAALGLGFFCVVGLGLEPCVLDSTSDNYSSVFTLFFSSNALHLITERLSKRNSRYHF